MEDKSFKKAKTTIIVSIVFTLLVMIGGTFAWFTWSSEDNVDITATVEGVQINYAKGADITGTLNESTDYTGGISTTIEFWQGTPTNIQYNGTISMDVTTISPLLTTNGLKWAVVTDNNVVASGDFVGNASGDSKTLYADFPLYFTSKNYTVYVWLDSTMISTTSIAGNTFSATVKASAVQVEVLPNAPELPDGMIPIKYNGNNWVKADYLNANNEWYDYNNKMWANAVLVNTAADTNVTGSKSRLEYMESIPGTEVLESDILAYYVWIPRYSYKLFNVEFAAVTPQEIEIAFERGNSIKNVNNTNNTWLTHPAFTFGDEELSGIWVGKFEITSETSCTATNNVAVNEVNTCNRTDINPTIKPGITSWRGAMVSTHWQAAQKIKTNTNLKYLTVSGANQIDSHLMKNIEWGVVAYLSYSIYGKNSEIDINNNGATYYTGGGEGNSYKTNVGQSTTGNITGAYDMSGNSWEYVMGVMKDDVSGSGKPMSGESLLSNYHSGFNGKLYNGSTWSDYSGGINFPDPKYYDLYNFGTLYSDYSRSHLGDATGETRGWNSDNNLFVNAYIPWFVRGETCYGSSGAGLFTFDRGRGYSSIGSSTRLIITNVG